MSVRVTCVDEQTGEEDTAMIADGDYMLITVEPCYEAHVSAYRSGTHVVTIKGRKPLAPAELADPAAGLGSPDQ